MNKLFTGIMILGFAFTGVVYAMPQEAIPVEYSQEEVIDLSTLPKKDIQQAPLEDPEIEPVYEVPAPVITPVEASHARLGGARRIDPEIQRLERIVRLLQELVGALQGLVNAYK